MPSGSDAEYIPLVIAKILNGADRKIINMVTCNEEVGSGTLGAAGGRFFSTIEPIPGYTGHMDGGVKIDDPLDGLAGNVETIAINARHVSGDVINADDTISEALKAADKENAVPLVHSVYGSKTGICQDLQAFAKE